MNRVSVIGVTQKTNMNYISATKKKLVGRNNQVCTSPIVLDYSTTEDIQFQLIDEKNQIQPVSGLTGLYFAGSLGVGQQSYDLLFLSKDFTVSEDVITFRVDTYTRNYLDKIKKKGTEINIEIGQISLDVKRVILRDYALAMPRVYVAGLSPQEIESNDYYTKEEVDGLIRAVQPPTKLSELENDKGFVDSAYVTGAVSGKLDAPSGGTAGQVLTKTEAGEEWASAPTKLSELENDKGFVDSAYVTAAVSGKLDAPSGGTAGQVLTKTEAGEAWADQQGGDDPKNVPIEEKTSAASNSYVVDFKNGKKIQKYGLGSAASGTIEISIAGMDGIPNGVAPTVELQIPVFEEVSTVSLPASLHVISMPQSLAGGEEGRDYLRYAYHDIVFRAERDCSNEWKTYVNYAYDFTEDKPIEDTREYFYIEAMEDGSTFSCNGFNASYKLSSSFDRVNWTALTGSIVATGVSAGTKMYLIGDTTDLGSLSYTAGWTIYSDKSYKLGGKAFSLFSDLLKDKTLTNLEDLTCFQENKTLLKECSVDFTHIVDAYGMFYNCSSLSSLPKGFSCPNATDTNHMFYGCSSLSSLPDDFSCPNATNTSDMFSSCKLSGLPDGFSCPNATDTNGMFSFCHKLSGLPDGFSCPNTTNTQSMFSNCSSLSGLPDGFSCPNTTDTSDMFNYCLRLSGLPDGFSCPNTTSTQSMFYDCFSLTRLPDGFSCPNATNTKTMFYHCAHLSGLPDGFSCPNATNTQSMFSTCSRLSGLPDGFSCPNTTSTSQMLYDCSSLTTIGSNVKIANGASATSTDDTRLDKSQITTIGDNFEWFTNATFSGTWDPALGIKNVFPNATAGSGWKVYNHHDGE